MPYLSGCAPMSLFYKTAFDARLHELEDRVERSWWCSDLRKRTDDGDRIEVKEARRLRAIRLFFRIAERGRLARQEQIAQELLLKLRAQLVEMRNEYASGTRTITLEDGSAVNALKVLGGPFVVLNFTLGYLSVVLLKDDLKCTP